MKATKPFNGKAIYQPSGKAGEYAKWACNFYVGCSNGCTYCYCKKGILAGVMGQDKPQLKKCFKDEYHALEIFKNEIKANESELKKHGLFLSFTTDPCLKETIWLTSAVLTVCNWAFGPQIPVKILTKCTWWVNDFIESNGSIFGIDNPELIAFGFTLTGHDELEPNASTNVERIAAMKKLHDAGFKTFASIEPVIDLDSSLNMINRVCNFQCCDLLKIGLLSGAKYDKNELNKFIDTSIWFTVSGHDSAFPIPIYFKDSLLKQAAVSREILPVNCVTRDYNLFE